MPLSFPNSGRVNVPSALAGELLSAARRLPSYENHEFYSLALQASVRDRIRGSCPAGFDWIIGQINERIAKWPYCALLRGLDFDEGNKLFVAINRAFGELVARPYEKPRAQLVHYVQPATDLPSARGGHESERLHTVTADWVQPVELISMVCVRADPGGGGRSRLLDIDAVRDEVDKRLGHAALEHLESTPVPWKLAAYCGGGVKWRPVLAESKLCWRRYTIDQGQLSRDTIDSLDSFEQVITATERTLDFLMVEGELLFSDNRRTIHARTAIAGGGTSDRLMIRSWVRRS